MIYDKIVNIHRYKGLLIQVDAYATVTKSVFEFKMK